MNCVKISVAHDDEVLRKHHRSSFMDGRRTLSHPLHTLPEDTVIGNNQQAGCVDHTAAILPPPHNTPPQVDISACSYVKRKTRADNVGRWGRTCSARVIPRPLTVSPSKNAIAGSFYRVPLLPRYKILHRQRCNCPADRQGETGDRRTGGGVVFHGLDRLIFEGAQKKGGNRPEPGKPVKPKKPKPEREGDKGKRKGKIPRTEELVPSIMQKNGFLLSTHRSANLPGCVGSERYLGVLRREPFRGWRASVARAFSHVPCFQSCGRVVPGY